MLSLRVGIGYCILHRLDQDANQPNAAARPQKRASRSHLKGVSGQRAVLPATKWGGLAPHGGASWPLRSSPHSSLWNFKRRA
jgi:hypothetical protein